MLTEAQTLALLADLESFRVERTVSTSDTSKFCQAICAFANDMPASGLPGYLLIGAHDKTGQPSGLQVSDEMLRYLGSLTADGNILPPPAVSVYRIQLNSGVGELAVIEVSPSALPPVRYKGQAWIRRGPRKAIANESEESLLIERRIASARTFDARPCPGATLSDLALDLFTQNYRPQAIAADVIAENHRSIEHQLASLRFFDLKALTPTHAGILLFARDPLAWLPGAYVQYIRCFGTDLSGDIMVDKRFQGDFLTVTRDLNQFVSLVTNSRPVRHDALTETMVADYPEEALRELLMNALLHRSYEASAPVRIQHFDDRMEISNPGPLYGEARPENFPRQTSYRNPVLAEAMRTLGLVNRFGRGVERAQSRLAKNGSPPAQFEFGDTFFLTKVSVRP